MNAPDVKTLDVTVSRLIPATPAAVYDAWIDPSSPGGLWFGVAKVILNPVVDGLFYHRVHHEGRDWPHYGRFIRLDRGHAIEHTWVSEATRGLESVVTITFALKGDQTEVTLHHANVPDDELGRSHKEGWAWYLDVLHMKFEKAKAGQGR